jgi:electron transport complex protein RnfA
LAACNSVVLGQLLVNAERTRGLLETFLASLGAAVGFGLVLLLFAGLRERLETADVPVPFRGLPIALVTAGILSLAFMGLNGLGR